MRSLWSLFGLLCQYVLSLDTKQQSVCTTIHMVSSTNVFTLYTVLARQCDSVIKPVLSVAF